MTNALKTLKDLLKKMKSRKALKTVEATSSNEAKTLPVELEKILSELALFILSNAKTPLSITIAPLDPGLPNYPIQPHAGHRIYDANECLKIGKKSRAFLAKMEKERILTPQLRECVIDQLMQLQVPNRRRVPLAYTKWVMFKILQIYRDPLGSNMAYFESLMQNKEMNLH